MSETVSNAWDRTKISVKLVSSTNIEVGSFNLAKSTLITSDLEEKLIATAINMAATKSTLSQTDMNASILFTKETTLPTASDINFIEVRYAGQESWCGGCLALKAEVEELKQSEVLLIAKVEALEQSEVLRKQHEMLLVAMGDLIGELYEYIYDIVLSMDKFPLQFKGRTMDLALFLKHSSNEKGELRSFLELALMKIDVTVSEYNIMSRAKQFRNRTYHYNTSNENLLEIVSSSPSMPDVEEARSLLLKHRSLFVKADDTTKSSAGTEVDDHHP